MSFSISADCLIILGERQTCLVPVEGGEREGQKQIAVAFPRDCYYKDGGSSQGRRVKSGSNGKIGGNKQLSFKTMSSVSFRSVNIIIYYILQKNF